MFDLHFISKIFNEVILLLSRQDRFAVFLLFQNIFILISIPRILYFNKKHFKSRFSLLKKKVKFLHLFVKPAIQFTSNYNSKQNIKPELLTAYYQSLLTNKVGIPHL